MASKTWVKRGLRGVIAASVPHRVCRVLPTGFPAAGVR